MPDLSESIEIAAEPVAVYTMVSDLRRMGEWSPENTGARWLGKHKAPVLGARFIGFNRHGKLIWFTFGRIAVADPGREFAFEVSIGPAKVARWEYLIEPTATGCKVTESWTDRRADFEKPLLDKLFGTPRDKANAKGMQITLARLKKAAERSTAVQS